MAPDRHPTNDSSSDLEEAFSDSDIARQFGATIDVAGPDPDDAAFFLVKRRGSVDPASFREWLIKRVGGRDSVLLESQSGLFVVWMQFHTARHIRADPKVALVGGISVDINRLNKMLGGLS